MPVFVIALRALFVHGCADGCGMLLTATLVDVVGARSVFGGSM